MDGVHPSRKPQNELEVLFVLWQLNPIFSSVIGPRREKTCLRWCAKNKGADQPAHTRSLISAFVIRLLKSMKSTLATNKFLVF